MYPGNELFIWLFWICAVAYGVTLAFLVVARLTGYLRRYPTSLYINAAVIFVLFVAFYVFGL